MLFLMRIESLVLLPATSYFVRLPRPISYWAMVVGSPAMI